MSRRFVDHSACARIERVLVVLIRWKDISMAEITPMLTREFYMHGVPLDRRRLLSLIFLLFDVTSTYLSVPF